MSDEYYVCPKKTEGCNSSYPTFNELLAHLQNECIYFGSKYYPLLPKQIKNPESFPVPNITKFLINNEEPIEEEKPELYFFQSTQPQRNRILKKSDKQIRAGPQKFIKDKEIPNTDSVEISKCLLKSGIMAIDKLYIDGFSNSSSNNINNPNNLNNNNVNKKKIKYLQTFPTEKY